MTPSLRHAAFVAILALSACTTPPQEQQQPTTQAAESGPPLVDGLYVVPHACPGEGCELGAWIATKDGELRASADQTAPIIARVAATEHVEAINSVLRLKPVRGVVTRANQGLEIGDVVYLLDSMGEGFFTLWRRGEQLTWSWPSEQGDSVNERTGVNWDKPDAEWTARNLTDPREGWWIQIRRTNGQTGWTRAEGYQCRPTPEDPSHCQLM